MGKRRESLLNFNALVEGVFFVDLKLSQNPYMPTTNEVLYIHDYRSYDSFF